MDDVEASNHVSSHCYHVRARVDSSDTFQNVVVCHKAFLALHRIINHSVQTLKKQLTEIGESQIDGRDKHKKQTKSTVEETKSKIFNFNKCYYSLKDTSKVYIPEGLDKTKLHRMYNESNKEHTVGLTTFREIFDGNFNISFGYS